MANNNTKTPSQAAAEQKTEARKASARRFVTDGEHALCVIAAGFVYTGMVFLHDDPVSGAYLEIANCYNVREWGTTAGLGQLAIEGRQPGTRLDRVGVVVVPLDKLIHYIPCPALVPDKNGQDKLLPPGEHRLK